MANYTATYKCGHTEGIKLYGKIDDRDRQLQKIATSLCPACRRKANEEKTGIVLVGSDKQANWAYDIIAKLNARMDVLKSKINEQFVDQLEQVRADYNANTSAKWWIDNEYISERDIAQAIANKLNK